MPLNVNALMLTPDRSPEGYRLEQLQDETLARILKMIEKNEKPGPNEDNTEVKAAAYQWKNLGLIDGVRYRKFAQGNERVNQYVVAKHKRTGKLPRL